MQGSAPNDPNPVVVVPVIWVVVGPVVHGAV